MKFNIRHLVMTALVTSVATASVALASDMKPTHVVEGISSYQLDNGLQVILFADTSKATATVNTTYLVGSRQENYGETGMAHLLEHLMFKGSKNYPDPSKEFTRRGFRMNGTTWLDRTNYFVSFTATDDNMKWALGWSADAMVNSNIAKKDLDTEMTVVRNEYEMGENKPIRVMLKRMQSVLFDWHNYGKSTIGARSDIENVPIENLQAFYHKWYQPDNAVLTVSGKFDEKKVLGWIQESFGKIPRPTRVLPKEWTQEPVADGPREFQIRRPGEMQLVAVGYRIPSALHEDTPAIETAVDILADAPRGRLYKNLVETGLASEVFAWPMELKDPGFVLFGAIVKKGKDIEKAKNAMIKEIETAFKKKKATKDEVKVSVTEAATEFERTLSDPEEFAVDLSDYIALGDWRLFFYDRDKSALVKPEDVNRVAKTYFVRDNRVVGLFIPDKSTKRAPEMTSLKAQDVLKGVKFKEGGDVAETFEATAENILKRTERLNINGVEVALLPKKTRGGTVTVMTKFRYGNLAVAKNSIILDSFVEPMLIRGTKKLNRKAIADAMTNFKMQGGLFAFTTTRENVTKALTLLGTLTCESAYPAKEFKQYAQQFITMLEAKSDDPVTMARDRMREAFNTYEKGDPRNLLTTTEALKAAGALTRDKAFAWYKNVVSTQNGTVAIVGDFDAKAVKAVLNKTLGAKKYAGKKYAYERFDEEYKAVEPGRFLIDTPQKENAIIFLRQDFPANLTDKEAAAYSVANWILGGGTGLSNRLVDRLRQKEGLSYGVGSHVQLPSRGNRAYWLASAIVAPQNLAKAEKCLMEELTRAAKEGFTELEVQEAVKGILQHRAVNRAQDDYLALSWLQFIDCGKSFAFSNEFEAALSKVTLKEANEALRRMANPKKIVYAIAGDLAKDKKLKR